MVASCVRAWALLAPGWCRAVPSDPPLRPHLCRGHSRRPWGGYDVDGAPRRGRQGRRHPLALLGRRCRPWVRCGFRKGWQDVESDEGRVAQSLWLNLHRATPRPFPINRAI